jgi:MFS transporter, DHA1 family, tetracycline resistance protein
MLLVTTTINIIGYVGTYLAIKFGSTVWIVWFAFYLFTRLIAGIGGAWFGVVQAYISDISSPADRAKNMGMMGAAFGMAFLIGPAIGGILSSIIGIEWLLIVSTLIIVANLLWIIYGLPEPKHHVAEMQEPDMKEWNINREAYFLLFISLMASIGFSAIQWWSSQYTADRFAFDPAMIGYSMASVGITSIIYQGFLIKHIRKIFTESQMIKVWLFLLTIGLSIYAWNPYPWFVFIIVILFPIGMWSIGPAIAALLSKDAGKHAGRVMGMNTSVTWVGGIIGPMLVGWLYALHIELPFWVSAWVFLFLLITTFIYFSSHQKINNS